MLNDIDHYTIGSEGQLKHKTDLLKNLCPYNCSNNGFCTNSGTCECNNGFSRFDCSLDLAKPPLLYKTNFDQDKIDFSKESLREIIFL